MPDPSAKPIDISSGDHPRPLSMGRTNRPRIGPCIGTLAPAESMLAIMMAQP